MVDEDYTEYDVLKITCGICGSDDAKCVCYVCHMPVCKSHARTVASVLGKKLPFSVHYCTDCHKKWLRRIMHHYHPDFSLKFWRRLKKTWEKML